MRRNIHDPTLSPAHAPVNSPLEARTARVLRSIAGALILLLTACGDGRDGDDEREDGDPMPETGFELEEVAIAQLQEGMAAGRWSSRELVRAYLDRIERIDAAGPTLRAVLDLNPDALAIADSLDAERERGRVRGPLHGIPVLIKGNIDTADRLPTTAGALAMGDFVATRDAFIVSRLREAGAVILGKTNLSEWANFRSTHSSSGWSGRGGQTRNPYVLDRSPCGSSSGSGVAIAASLAAVAIGTETDGSIVCPASANALVGIKPTMGLVSRSGIIPIAASQDIAGPMARTVADAALLLGVLAGADPADPATAASAGRVEPDYTRFLDPNGLRGARIGVARARVTGYSAPTDALFEAAVADLRRAGAVIVDSTDIPFLGEYDAAELTVLLYEFRDGIDRYLRAAGPGVPVKSLEEVIRFNAANRARAMPFFGQELLEMAQEKGPLTDAEYLEAKALSRRAAEGLDRVMREHRLDALVAPTGSPAWPIDLLNGDHFLGASSTAPAVAGYPSVSVPMGSVAALPVGITFIGKPWQEGTLIRFAYAYEQATRHRRPPRFLPTVDHELRTPE